MEQIIDSVEKEVKELTNAINDFGVLLEDPANAKIKSSRLILLISSLIESIWQKKKQKNKNKEK